MADMPTITEDMSASMPNQTEAHVLLIVHHSSFRQHVSYDNLFALSSACNMMQTHVCGAILVQHLSFISTSAWCYPAIAVLCSTLAYSALLYGGCCQAV